MLTSMRSVAGTSPIRLHEGPGAVFWLGVNSLYVLLTMSLLHLRGRSPAHRRSGAPLARCPCGYIRTHHSICSPTYNPNGRGCSEVATHIHRAARSVDPRVIRTDARL